MKKFHYAAIVPCYNVGRACEPVIQKTSQFINTVVAVNDGSTDDTASVLSKLNLSNLSVLQHPANRGKGAALMTGFRHLIDTTDCDAIITLDSDGQHDPSLLPEFQRMFDSNQPDLVYGNRMVRMSGMPHHRRWLNSLSNRIVSRICKQPIADSQCGFRLYSRKLLMSLMDQLRTSRYELETEILILCCLKGMSVESVPIPMIYSPQSTQLSNHSLTDVLRITRLLWKYW
jgi:glycosyltransferase involved in cell wall biosynthesis